MQRLTKEELLQIKAVGNPKLSAIAEFASRQFTCSHCGKCTRRCEVLAGPKLDIGTIEKAYNTVAALPEENRADAVRELMASDYSMYNALRQCCFCGHCTAACGNHVLAPDVMRAWRELFMQCGFMPPNDSKLVMVDNEWHIFSAYRAIYEIYYPQFTMLCDAACESNNSGESNSPRTLLFPGCSLVTYAPEVVAALGDWLNDSGIDWVLSDDCCGSPLMSAGLFERAQNLREKIIEQMRHAKIERMVTICPGCADEFREFLPEDIQLVPLPELLYKQAQIRLSEGKDSGFSPMNLNSVTFFDSCHDRHNMRNAKALRRLFKKYIPNAEIHEMTHAKRATLCCGAGGAVGSYDADITDRRVWRVIEEARATGAETLITMCPTCTYTIAQANLAHPQSAMNSLHYLEVLFNAEIDWNAVFYQLNAMWSGEWGPWLNQTFF